ncbi:MAG: 6-carboxytetrahydropterin synthase QueD [Desulforudis sp.]|jgi:6-pyruvoyltetrahydropterin/6-carboxytetrahydropterin synthase|nr:6-carboxytetrahydropterin synthase QueD [Clostridia bacterium]MDQ7791705.1 6-carboxytetrahydropterin synthase QueD [Clostridia bacterium]RJX22869.1 MAG: 6-carboxytetrahydropterin synthase QueD [Desulforudis sp.]
MYELTVRASFAAAHRLCNHPTKCRHLHGHTWDVELTVAGRDLNADGMLLDFGHLKSLLREIVDGLDHSYLNEHPAFGGEGPDSNPTAENIARHIFTKVKNDLVRNHPAVRLRSVTVWESPKSSVRYTEE